MNLYETSAQTHAHSGLRLGCGL